MVKKVLLIAIVALLFAGCAQQQGDSVTPTIAPDQEEEPIVTSTINQVSSGPTTSSPVVDEQEQPNKHVLRPIPCQRTIRGFVCDYNYKNPEEVYKALAGNVKESHSLEEIREELSLAEKHNVSIVEVRSRSIEHHSRYNGNEISGSVSGVHVVRWSASEGCEAEWIGTQTVSCDDNRRANLTLSVNGSRTNLSLNFSCKCVPVENEERPEPKLETWVFDELHTVISHHTGSG